MAPPNGRDSNPPGAAGRSGPPARDALSQKLHFLGNNIHSLSLRLFVLQSSDLPADVRTHVDAAHRLAQQSAEVMEQIHDLLQAQMPAAGSARTGATRRNRP
jgi:hypothetical protein